MTTITLHQVGYRDGRPIARPVTASMRRQVDPVEVATRAWGVLVDRSRWSTTLVGTDTDRAVYAVRRAVPEVDQVFGEVALRAGVGRRLGPGTCKWCLVPLIAQALGQAEPLFDPAHRRLLGQPCAGCAPRLRDQVLAGVSHPRGSLVASADARQHRGVNSRDVPTPDYYRRRPWPPEVDELRERAARMYQQARQRQAAAWNGPTLRRTLVPRGRP